MLEVWCELVCGTCAVAGPGSHSYKDRVPRVMLRKRAEREGWQFEGDLPFCSQECKNKFNSETK